MEQHQGSVVRLSGFENGHRIESRILEERIQQAVEKGSRVLEIEAFGQHGIGGRLWKGGDEKLHVKISGAPGQRVGSMGFPNTLDRNFWPVFGRPGLAERGSRHCRPRRRHQRRSKRDVPGPDLYIGKNRRARHDHDEAQPAILAPRAVGAGLGGRLFRRIHGGGIAVVCGHEPQDPENVLGFRPCVGMVGGKVFFRGPQKSYSKAGRKANSHRRQGLAMACRKSRTFLAAIGKTELMDYFRPRAMAGPKSPGAS